MLRRIQEALPLIEEHRRQCLANGFLYSLITTEPFLALCKVLHGHIGDGIGHIEAAILTRESEGYETVAEWYRIILCEVYLQIIAGNEKQSFSILLKNLPIILRVFFIAPSRIRALTASIAKNPQLDPSGCHVGRVQMILGLLYKIRKRHALAVRHLTEARQIFSQFGQTPILVRVDAALAELGQ